VIDDIAAVFLAVVALSICWFAGRMVVRLYRGQD
jgi:hypothetical protein